MATAVNWVVLYDIVSDTLSVLTRNIEASFMPEIPTDIFIQLAS